MSDLPPPPPPPPSGGYNPPPPPPPPPPPSPPPGGGYVPPPPQGYVPSTGYGGYGYAAQRTDGLAIAALVLGILAIFPCSLVCLGLILGPIAAIMGFISRQRIASSGGTVGGGTLAVVGLVLGIIGFAASVGWFFFIVISGALGQSTAGPTP